MSSLRTTLFAFLFALPTAERLRADETAYDPIAVCEESLPDPIDLIVVDEKRSREIPVRVFLPQDAPAAPIVLFSHGLGGARSGYSYLGKHWAARGNVVVFLQHPGSDESLWRGKPLAQGLEGLWLAINAKNLRARMGDVSAVLERLEQWNVSADHAFARRLNLAYVGMAGHSFGAATTQAVSGQAFVRGAAPTVDKRIKAALALSPSSPRHELQPVDAFGHVAIPWMLMTGTHDWAPVGDQTIASRQAVFPALPAGGKYELVLDRAAHLVFADDEWPLDHVQERTNYHRAILALSTAFWDAYLRDDAAAKAWLDGEGPRSVLEKSDRWQRK